MNLEIISGYYTDPGEGPAQATAAVIPLIIVTLYFVFGHGYINKHYLTNATIIRHSIIIAIVCIALVVLSLVLAVIGAKIAFLIGKAIY